MSDSTNIQYNGINFTNLTLTEYRAINVNGQWFLNYTMLSSTNDATDLSYYSNGISFYDNRQALDSSISSAISNVMNSTDPYSVLFSDVLNLTFNQVTPQSGFADITFGQASGAAYSSNSISASTLVYGSNSNPYSPVLHQQHGDIWFNGNSSTGWGNAVDTIGTVVHELGHALGLGHTDHLPSELDNEKYSIMSYKPHGWTVDGNNQLITTVNALYDTDGTSPLYASGLQLLDIWNLQQIYGANTTTRAGDTVYKLGQGLGSNINHAFIYTIYDAGGNDTIDASDYDEAVKINLNDGAFSSIGENGLSYAGYDLNAGRDIENVAIAYGTEIENAIGTDFNDLIIGNDLNNVLIGRAGNDAIIGGIGVDTADYVNDGSISGLLTINSMNSGFEVTDGFGDTDTLTGIEIIKAGDHAVTVNTSTLDGFKKYENNILYFSDDKTLEIEINDSDNITLNTDYFITNSLFNFNVSAETVDLKSVIQGWLVDVDLNSTNFSGISEGEGLASPSLTSTVNGHVKDIYLGQGDNQVNINFITNDWISIYDGGGNNVINFADIQPRQQYYYKGGHDIINLIENNNNYVSLVFSIDVDPNSFSFSETNIRDQEYDQYVSGYDAQNNPIYGQYLSFYRFDLVITIPGGGSITITNQTLEFLNENGDRGYNSSENTHFEINGREVYTFSNAYYGLTIEQVLSAVSANGTPYNDIVALADYNLLNFWSESGDDLITGTVGNNILGVVLVMTP